jgi:hypothetical protein
MRLDEIMGSPYQIMSGNALRDRFTFNFYTDDKQVYSVIFSWMDENRSELDMSFSKRDGGKHNVNVSGTGDAFRILATVKAICERALAKYHPAVFTFSAALDQPSRVKLYDALARQLARISPDYKFEGTADSGNFCTYRFVMKTRLTESAVDMRLAKIVRSVRDEYVSQYGKKLWGHCEQAAIDLVRRLVAAGYDDGALIHGHVDEAFDWPEGDSSPVTGHTWVVVHGFILDPTHEQFAGGGLVLPHASQAGRFYNAESYISFSDFQTD